MTAEEDEYEFDPAWWIIFGGRELAEKIKTMPDYFYMKYWMGRGLLDPFVDETATVAIVEFCLGRDKDWIDEYFDKPMAMAIDCQCKASIAVGILGDFEHHTEVGDPGSQIETIAHENFFDAKHCCMNEESDDEICGTGH